MCYVLFRLRLWGWRRRRRRRKRSSSECHLGWAIACSALLCVIKSLHHPCFVIHISIKAIEAPATPACGEQTTCCSLVCTTNPPLSPAADLSTDPVSVTESSQHVLETNPWVLRISSLNWMDIGRGGSKHSRGRAAFFWSADQNEQILDTWVSEFYSACHASCCKVVTRACTANKLIT